MSDINERIKEIPDTLGRTGFNDLLSGMVEDQRDRSQVMIREQNLIRYVRRANDQIFAQEHVRVQAFLIEATKKKMKIISNLLDGLDKIQQRLMTDDIIRSASYFELLDGFCKVTDKVIALSENLQGTYDIMRELKDKVPEYNASGSFQNMQQNGTTITPEVRKRVTAVFEVFKDLVSKEISKDLSKDAADKAKPVVEIQPEVSHDHEGAVAPTDEKSPIG